MPRTFISYSRKDVAFAQQLYDALTQSGRECWIDLKGIPPTAEWLEEIRGAIDGADAFVFIISPDSCASDVCQAEVAHAVERHKRLIPLHYRETPREAIPAAVARLNWIFFRDPAAFSADVAALETALDTDLEWVGDHTRLLLRAVDWDRHKRDASYTLRGHDLHHFEHWLTAAADKEPAPVSLQSEYVLASRRATTKRQRIIWSSVFAAVTMASVLSVVAYFQSRERDRQQRLAGARQLVNQADAIRALPVDSPEARDQIRESARVAIQALQAFEALGVPSVEADVALRSALSLLPVPNGEHEFFFTGSVDATAFDSAGRYLAVGHGDRAVMVLDVREGKELATCDVTDGDNDEILAVAVASNGESIAVSRTPRGTAGGTIDVWRLPACQRVFRTAEPARYQWVLLDPQGRWVGTHFTRRSAFWDIATGNAIPYDIGEDIVTAAAADASGNLIAVSHRQPGSHGYRLSVRRVLDNDVSVAWALQERPMSIRWMANPSRLLLEGDELLYVYDAGTGDIISRVPAPKRRFVASVDGALIAEEVGNSIVEIRDVSGATVRSRLSHARGVTTMAFRQEPDGATLTTVEAGAPDKFMRSWKVGSSAVADIAGRKPVERVFFSDDSASVHASGAGNTQSWQLTADDNGPRAHSSNGDASLAGVGERFRVVTDNPSTSSTKPSVRIVRTSDGADVARYEFDRQVVAAALSADGSTLAVATAQSTRAGWEATLHVTNVSSKQTIVAPLPGFHHNRDIRLLTVSPTGNYVGVASGRGFAVLDGRTLKPVTELYHPYPGGIAFQAAGSLVATTGIDRRTRVWNLGSNLEIARVSDEAVVKHLALSPDGRWLATATDKGAARIWAVRAADLIRQACARIGAPCP